MATSRRDQQFKAKLTRCHYDNRSSRVAAKEKEASAKLLANLMKKLEDALGRATEAKDIKMTKGKKMSAPKGDHVRKEFDEHIEALRIQSEQRHEGAAKRANALKAAKLAKASAIVSWFNDAEAWKKERTNTMRATQRAKFEAGLLRAHTHRQGVISKAARMGERRWETLKEAEVSELGARRRAMDTRHAAAEARAGSARREAVQKAARMGGQRQKRVKMTIEVRSPDKVEALMTDSQSNESMPKPSPTSFAGEADWVDSASRQTALKEAMEFAKKKLSELAEASDTEDEQSAPWSEGTQ